MLSLRSPTDRHKNGSERTVPPIPTARLVPGLSTGTHCPQITLLSLSYTPGRLGRHEGGNPAPSATRQLSADKIWGRAPLRWHRHIALWGNQLDVASTPSHDELDSSVPSAGVQTSATLCKFAAAIRSRTGFPGLFVPGPVSKPEVSIMFNPIVETST